MTWYESWSCSKGSTTRRVYTKGYPTTRPGRKRAAQPLNAPASRITAAKATATDCLNCQSRLKWQFAMYGPAVAVSRADSQRERPVWPADAPSLESHFSWTSSLPSIGLRSKGAGSPLRRTSITNSPCTPDDEARLRKEFHSATDDHFEKQLTAQARPNVLFEAGMAMGRDANRTVLVQVGQLRPFSDISGRHVLRLKNTSPSRQELADRLRSAGCDVDLSVIGTLSARLNSIRNNQTRLTKAQNQRKEEMQKSLPLS